MRGQGGQVGQRAEDRLVLCTIVLGGDACDLGAIGAKADAIEFSGAYADRAAHHHEVGADSDEDEVHELVGDLIDLEPVLRDAVVPTLPFKPVCRPDCPGLCSECGARLADDPDHHHDVFDPRWSARRGMLQDDPQEKRN